MVSVRNKFLFIHIPKTAGNSIQNILKDYSEDQIVVLNPHQNGIERFEVRNPHIPSHKHSPLIDYKRWLRDDFYNGLFKFSCVRNPWDRMISFYFSTPHLQAAGWNRSAFVDLVKSVKPMVAFLTTNPSIAMSDFDNKPEIEVDFVMRFEKLEDDFREVCRKLAIPFRGLPHRNKSDREHYSVYYDDGLIRLVAESFTYDIECFGYSFEEA